MAEMRLRSQLSNQTEFQDLDLHLAGHVQTALHHVIHILHPRQATTTTATTHLYRLTLEVKR
jgi:hypothetical protein